MFCRSGSGGVRMVTLYHTMPGNTMQYHTIPGNSGRLVILCRGVCYADGWEVGLDFLCFVSIQNVLLFEFVCH